MTPEDIVAKFAYSLDQFYPIAGQLSDFDHTRFREAIASLLFLILYDKTGAVHNLISLIWPEAAYVVRYGASFPKPARVGAYDPLIENNDMAVVRACTEEVHKANHTECVMYKTMRRETAQFFLDVVTDTWVRELRDMEKIYTDVAPNDLLSHLQVGCTIRHALDLLALHFFIQR